MQRGWSDRSGSQRDGARLVASLLRLSAQFRVEWPLWKTEPNWQYDPYTEYSGALERMVPSRAFDHARGPLPRLGVL